MRVPLLSLLLLFGYWPLAALGGAQIYEPLADSVREMFSLKNGRTSTGSPPLKKESSGEGKTVFVAIAARMVITPALFLPLMCLGAWLDLPTVFEE